ncbi:unnamed protein product [Durusdinium trenchii]
MAVRPYAWLPVVFMAYALPAYCLEWTVCQLWEQPALAFALHGLPAAVALIRIVLLFAFTHMVRAEALGLGILRNPDGWKIGYRIEWLQGQKVHFPWPLCFLEELLPESSGEGVVGGYFLIRTGCFLLYVLILASVVCFNTYKGLASYTTSAQEQALQAEEEKSLKQKERSEQAAMVKDLRMGRDSAVKQETAFWIYFDAVLVVYDMISDLVTVWTLLAVKRYELASMMVFIFIRSVLLQVSSGKPRTFIADVQASVHRGIRHQNFLDILQEERGFEAPFSLMLTSYSLLVCVNDVSSALRQSISILVSAYGLANFIYIQLDLNLVDEEEIQRAGVLENAVEEVIHASKSWKSWIFGSDQSNSRTGLVLFSEE